ncbi:Transcription initiation factor IIA subunit 2 [Oopsacas minuta]|uniref:Transcription initiation factor IIA subunit 2 n=1 Tax=Oopsacas minuta TaxID=111878 RepID=A0AAV7JP65_9METZ|nr:Transcription initiation factor IIA subunit 2 [Oopsacas minuta]
MSAYQHYRNTTLGNCLEEALEELIQSQNISSDLGIHVLMQFDRAMNHLLKDKVRNKFGFKGSLYAYRYCDNVWTYVLKDAEFKPSTKDGSDGVIQVSKVKFVACEALIQKSAGET